MYKCTECDAIFEQCPDYCDCGNDIFEEIQPEMSVQNEDEQENYIHQMPQRPVKKKRKLSQEEIQELQEAEEDKKKSINTIIVSLIVCFLILITPPYIEKKSNKIVKQQATKQINIPSVNSFWDDTIPSAYRQQSLEDNLPLLNNSFGNIPMSLHNYLIKIGEEFSSNWQTSLINGVGECKIQFTINKDGIIDNKKIIYKSKNETLDDSVLLVLSKMTNLEVPPEDYKGERIILSFKATGSANKVYYPTK